MKQLFLSFLVVTSLAFAGDDGDEVKSKAKSIWGKVKSTTKKTVEHVKKAGKEIGRGTQEIFDPNDEDLRHPRKD